MPCYMFIINYQMQKRKVGINFDCEINIHSKSKIISNKKIIGTQKFK